MEHVETRKNTNYTPRQHQVGHAFEALMVAMTTLFGYLVAYIFERSFLEYFGIPDQFISVTSADVLGCAIVVIFCLVFFAMLIEWSQENEYLEKHADYIHLTLRVIAIVAFSTALYLLQATEKERTATVIMGVVLIFCLEVCWPAWKYRSRRELNLWGKIVVGLKTQREKMDADGILDRIAARTGLGPVLVFALGISILMFAYYAGIFAAGFQKQYGTIEINGRKLILIRHYDSQFIFVPVDLAQKIVDAEIVVLTSDALVQKGLSIKMENVGPLRRR